MYDQKTRCGWCESHEIYMDYHDHEWGLPCYDDQRLFEMLLLEGAQAGLSWITILKKREGYRKAFDNFDPEVIANYGEEKRQELLQNPEIVRNRLKINAFITNAQSYLEIVSKQNSFSNYIWQFVDGYPKQNSYSTLDEIPANTSVSDLMSKELKKKGFKFVGTTICYAYMQSMGMVNDHITSCFRYMEVID